MLCGSFRASKAAGIDGSSTKQSGDPGGADTGRMRRHAEHCGADRQGEERF